MAQSRELKFVDLKVLSQVCCPVVLMNVFCVRDTTCCNGLSDVGLPEAGRAERAGGQAGCAGTFGRAVATPSRATAGSTVPAAAAATAAACRSTAQAMRPTAFWCCKMSNWCCWHACACRQNRALEMTKTIQKAPPPQSVSLIWSLI